VRLAASALAVACAVAAGLPGPAPDAAPAGRDPRFADLDHREAIRVDVADALLCREMTLGAAADWFGRLAAEDEAAGARGRAARRAVAYAARLAAARPAAYPPGRVAELEAELHVAYP
jgi:hypothetical protein